MQDEFEPEGFRLGGDIDESELEEEVGEETDEEEEADDSSEEEDE